jgi:cytochrome P450
MTTTAPAVAYDMYDRAIYASPYETYRRLRDEAPIYYNDSYDFHAVSRFDDVLRVLTDRDAFLSGRGSTYSNIKADVQIPEGLFVAEDDPIHAVHRGLVSRLFTPRSINGLEPRIRALCDEMFDSVAGLGRFDFMKDVAVKIPVRVIAMLVGLPESDHAELHEIAHQTENSTQEVALAGISAMAGFFDEYLAWREGHPTDDIMSQLLTMEFEDQTGTIRHLSRQEMVTFLVLVTSAGSDTTATALGWAAKVLADHPDSRRELADDLSLVTGAAEEVLRIEPPSYHFARYVARDVEFHGTTVPEGSVIVVVPGAANRDERHFPEADRFDIGRKPGTIFTFSFGTHFCLGAALARLELRIGIETMLQRFGGQWTVDEEQAVMREAVNTRGYEHLPVEV